MRTRVASALATGVGAGGCRDKEPIGGFVLRRPTVLRCLAGLPALGTNTCECASVEADTFVTASACILAAPRRPRTAFGAKTWSILWSVRLVNRLAPKHDLVGIRVRLKKPSGKPPTARQHAAFGHRFTCTPAAASCVGRKRDRAAFEYEFQFVEYSP